MTDRSRRGADPRTRRAAAPAPSFSCQTQPDDHELRPLPGALDWDRDDVVVSTAVPADLWPAWTDRVAFTTKGGARG